MLQSLTPFMSDLVPLVDQLIQAKNPRSMVGPVVEALGPLSFYDKSPSQDHEAYARTVLYSTPLMEIMVAAWRQGHECLPHDHGQSLGYVINLRGQFIETAYTWREGHLVPIRSYAHTQERSLLQVNQFHVHSMHCENTNGLTLHMYSPAIEQMKVFDLAGQKTLTVANQCGAWIPSDSSQILNITPWYS